jgi:hypothetical protein
MDRHAILVLNYLKKILCSNATFEKKLTLYLLGDDFKTPYEFDFK